MSQNLRDELKSGMDLVTGGSTVELTDGEPFKLRRSISVGNKVWEVECEDTTKAFIVIDCIVAIWV